MTELFIAVITLAAIGGACAYTAKRLENIVEAYEGLILVLSKSHAHAIKERAFIVEELCALKKSIQPRRGRPPKKK